jgi:type II secretory pathway predicted ATPase ExeA
VVPYAVFALSENVVAFLPVLKLAVMRRGLPKRLYVDNGAAYRSYHLALVCARLGVTLIHARAYQPQSKGKMERWFRTVRTQFLPTLSEADTASLEALNRRLWAWVEGEYHQSPHRGLDGETPLDRWAARSAEVRHVEPGVDLDELFLAEAKRKVQKDRTVSLNGLVYEVDASLVGATVTLRFEPATQQRGVQVWHGGRKVQDAKVVNQLLRQARAPGPPAGDVGAARCSASWPPVLGSPARRGGGVAMYRKHFGLLRHPFAKDLAPEELFVSNAGRELEVRLGHLLELRGIGLVTGEVGSGKTTLCRKVVAGLHTGLYRVFYVPLTTGNVMDMYKSIAWELGLPTERSRAALYKCIRDEVTRLCAENKVRPILIVDEAQHLRSDVLEDLRLLTNYEMDSQNRLCLILVGQAELRRRLGMAVHEALSQRVVVRHHLGGLTRDELPLYLQHLLRLAGTELPLFDTSAVEALYQATSGLPRRLNLLAHHALMAAALAKAKAATAEHVAAALPEAA